MCPFGVIKMRRDGKAVVKCDLCQSRQEEGKQPACVEACPTGALTFIEVEEVEKQRRSNFLVSWIKGERKAEEVKKE